MFPMAQYCKNNLAIQVTLDSQRKMLLTDVQALNGRSDKNDHFRFVEVE